MHTRPAAKRAEGEIGWWGRALPVGVFCFVVGAALCVWGPTPSAHAEERAQEPAEEVEQKPAKLHNPDPWEPFNRAVFFLNEWGDILLVTPLAEGWRFLTPGFFRDGVTNFNDTLGMPVILGNNVFQLKPTHVRDDAFRMVFNLSFGIGGLIDVASAVDISQNDEDFGQTLGYWGVPSGPYVVLPVFGPSTVRDGFGRLADSAGTFYFSFLPFYSTLAVQTLEVVNLRSGYIEEVDANRADSFDYYVFLRNAYLQNRRAKIGAPESRQSDHVDDDDLYQFEDEEEFDYDSDDGADDDTDEGADAVDPPVGEEHGSSGPPG